MNLPEKDTRDLGELVNRAMKQQVNIQEGDVMVSADDSTVYITPIA